MTLEHVPPNIREAIGTLVGACRDVFGDRLRCVVVKGSLVKGDFIPGYSDLDLHAFVDPEVLMSDRTPTPEFALRFQERIGPLDPRAVGVSQFQVYFLPADRQMDDWSPPVPGSYEVVSGEPTASMRDWERYDYVAKERRDLGLVSESRRALVHRVLDKPNASLPMFVRLAGTYVKGFAYSAAVVASGDPKRALTMRTSDLLEFLEELDPSLSSVRAFFDFIADWTRVEHDPERAREAFRRAIEALEAIERWAAPHVAGRQE